MYKDNKLKIFDNENNNYNSNNLNDTIDEYQELLLNQEKNLPVPIEKKNDEKFKLMKMRQMKRKSFPANNYFSSVFIEAWISANNDGFTNISSIKVENLQKHNIFFKIKKK